LRFQSIYRALTGGLLVSCQAPEGDPFHDPDSVAHFAQAAERGGAAGLRVNGPRDIEATRRVTGLPIIGIQKREISGRLRITPFFDDASALVRAGAQIIAIQCTAGAGQHEALRLVAQVRRELDVPVMADIATFEEAIAAEAAGADLIASTMRGYTPETSDVHRFEPDFIARLSKWLQAPVIAEGRVQTPAQAAEALKAGALAVVVGGAITGPELLTVRFVSAMRDACSPPPDVIGIDLGGTTTKIAVVSAAGTLVGEAAAPTPVGDRASLISHVACLARRKLEEAQQAGLTIRALGVATAGWVDAAAGRVVYATGNLPGWTGTDLRRDLESELQLPVAVENDANAFAIGESRFGQARRVRDFVCITLGTGVGGACVSSGHLIRGASCFAGALGHIPLVPDGVPCGCGLSGCLEYYTNAAALVRYAGGAYTCAEAVIRAAHEGDDAGCAALMKYAGYLASGIAIICQMLDPELVILAGGIAQNNPMLVSSLIEAVPRRIMASQMRRLKIVRSELGYYAGVFGAGAIARDEWLTHEH
jgi:N-acetylmannosamine-6-phosphate 2-epimerase/N-acetylmannosamine kinase